MNQRQGNDVGLWFTEKKFFSNFLHIEFLYVNTMRFEVMSGESFSALSVQTQRIGKSGATKVCSTTVRRQFLYVGSVYIFHL